MTQPPSNAPVHLGTTGEHRLRPLSRAEFARCELRVRDRVLHYRRAGHGPVVMLVLERGDDHALWPELHDALAEQYRVIVPELDAPTTPHAAWFWDLLEGLGITRLHLVAASPFLGDAATILKDGGECVAGLIFVSQEGGQAEPEPQLRSRAPLRLDRTLDAEAAVAAIRAYLSETGPVTPRTKGI